MSNSTINLHLTKPALDDEIHQTISDLANNFQKLDDASEISLANVPTTGDWLVPKRIWHTNPAPGGFVGWITIRSGRACPYWLSSKSYVIGDQVMPLTDNGHYYECVQSGTSGLTIPPFPTAASMNVEDTMGAVSWQPSHLYALHDIVKPSISNDRYYVCTAGGTSGTAEPGWTTTELGTTTDGTVTWTCYKVAIWKEKGAAALFKPFGAIAT